MKTPSSPDFAERFLELLVQGSIAVWTALLAGFAAMWLEMRRANARADKYQALYQEEVRRHYETATLSLRARAKQQEQSSPAHPSSSSLTIGTKIQE